MQTMLSVICGPNVFLAKAELAKRVDSFLSEHGDLALERIDCAEVEIERVFEAVGSMPFLSAKKMVILNSLGKNKNLADKFEQILSTKADSTDLILYEPSIDKRTVYYKALKKQSGIQEFNYLDERGLANWLVSYSAELGGQISYGDAVYLIDRAGQNQFILASELQKLIIYSPSVTKESINLLTEPTPQSKIFDLLDQAFAGNSKKALELYDDQRAQKVEPAQIMGMLVWQLNILALVVYAGASGSAQIAKSAGLNPYVVDKTKKLASSIVPNHLKTLINRAQQLDIDSKTTGLNIDLALKHYILTIK